MKFTPLRLFAVLTALVVAIGLAGAAAKSTSVLAPDKLVILSTVDVKGKTSPCG